MILKKRKILLILTIIIVISWIFFYIYKNNHDAKKLLSNLKCEEAAMMYQKLNILKKNETKIKKCKYNKAKEYYSKKDFENAYPIFASLDQYLDSKELYLNSYYEVAKKLKLNGSLNEAIIMFDQIIDYKDSEKLLNSTKKDLIENAQVGDMVFYGKYEQDGVLANGDELIEWIVISKNGEDLLLISKNILIKMEFGTEYYWSKSKIRNYLNDAFYINAFDQLEKEKLQKMITSNTTSDNVFLLSAEEARGLFKDDSLRIAVPTQKLLIDGFKDYKGAGQWWTRSISTASNGKGVVQVEASGNVRSAGIVPNPSNDLFTDIGVRPAISINKNTSSRDIKNMEIYGYNSNGDLDNEPYIAPSYEETQKRNCEITKIISNYNGCSPNRPHYMCYTDNGRARQCKCYSTSSIELFKDMCKY